MLMRRSTRDILFVSGLTIFFFTLRWLLPESIDQHLWGADGWFMADLVEGVESYPFPLYYRSLLAVWIDRLIYLLFSPLGISGWYAISISSSLAGAIAVMALWRINQDFLFIIINVFCGSFIVLIGHVENYAWVNAFLILSFLGVQRWLDNRWKVWPAFVFLALACLSHMLAVFYAPAYIYLLYKNRNFDPKEVLLPVIGFTMIIVVLSLGFDLMGTDNGLERLVPWGRIWAKNQFFTFLSSRHLEMLLYFHHRAAFLGIPLEIPLLLILWKRIDTVFLRFLGICVLCGLAWTTLWHPDWGMRDWDLFSQFGISLHILLGLLVRSKWRNSTTSVS